MGVWQGVAMDSLKFHQGPPCPSLLRLMGGPPLKRPYGRFRGSSSGHPTPYAYDFIPKSTSPAPLRGVAFGRKTWFLKKLEVLRKLTTLPLPSSGGRLSCGSPGMWPEFRFMFSTRTGRGETRVSLRAASRHDWKISRRLLKPVWGLKPEGVRRYVGKSLGGCHD
jgi:hypothetical protein